MLLVSPVQAQSAPDATDLLQKAKIFGENTRTWRAEAVTTTRVYGPGLQVPESNVHSKLAAQVQPSLKMSIVNSGDDRTVRVCDGTQEFYSADGLTYSLSKANGQCGLPLLSFYQPSLMNLIGPNSKPLSVSVVGEDHVRLIDGDRRCVLVRVVSVQETIHAVRTMCIDPVRPIILRDVVSGENEASHYKWSTTTTFTSFENNPTFAQDAFRITIPAGGYQAH
jgi:hypothetical protein